jgi:magnesium transporter
MSFILGEGFLLSFQEQDEDYYKTILDRIASHTTKVKQRKADYLLYYLVDLIVDQYYYAFESLNKRADVLEAEVLEDISPRTVSRIISLKQHYSEIQKQLDPVEGCLREIIKSETLLVEDYVVHYFNDVIDHIRQYRETIRQKQETLSSLIDLNMSIVSTRMNRVMYILTLVMTIFVPLTFIAGIYGMNFEFMPELGFKYGYFIALGAMIVIGIGILVYMKRKKWF